MDHDLPDKGAGVEAALQVVERWLAAFTSSDIETIVALYAPYAIFFGTESRSLLTDAEAIRQYFVHALSNRTRSARMLSVSVREITEGVVSIAGLNEVGERIEGNWQYRVGRLTLLLQRQDDKWAIVQFHRSKSPD